MSVRAAPTDFSMGGHVPPHKGLMGGGLTHDLQKNQWGTITTVKTFDNELYLGT